MGAGYLLASLKMDYKMKNKQEELNNFFDVELDDLFVVGIDKKIKSINHLKDYIQEHDLGNGVSRREIIENSNNPDIKNLIEKAKKLSEIAKNDNGNLKIMFWKEERVE